MRIKYCVGSVHQTAAGPLEVVERIPETKKVKVRFLNTGSTKTVYRETIARGNLKDDHLPMVCGIGYVGTGRYRHKTHPKLYDKWASMLKRCYSEAYNPSYAICEVCVEWYNFQNFAKWSIANGFHPDLQLDKDIRIKGNKMYGPDSCCYVTPKENQSEMVARMRSVYAHQYFLIEISTGKFIEGTNKNEFIRKNSLNRNFFFQLENGTNRTSRGYRIPTNQEIASYFALAGEEAAATRK